MYLLGNKVSASKGAHVVASALTTPVEGDLRSAGVQPALALFGDGDLENIGG